MNASKKVAIIYDEKRLAEGVQLGTLTSYMQEIIPASPASHIGQFVTPAGNGIMAWATINQVPASTASDENKVLTVNSSGNAEWATPSGGGSVTDVEVNGTSVVNASGVAEVTVPSGAQLVPAATSADADKVLTVDSQGIPGWAVVPSQSTGLFEAVYNSTSYAAIVQAINDKKIVYCRISATGASRMAFLAYIGSSNVEFQYYRSLNSHSASNMTDEVYVYTVSSSGWTTTTRKTGAKVVAGTHMSQSYSNDTLTLDCTWPTVDQTYDASSTNAQSGVAVASAIAAAQTGLFEATYGTTTYADVLQAISDNRLVYCNAPGAGNTRRMAAMTFKGADNVEFQYYRSNSSGTDSVFIYTVSSEGWTTTERTVTGYASPTYNASSTLAQSGVAVASAIAGVNAVPASTSADADKVLTVDAQGTPGWAAVSLGDVNNVLQVNALPATTEAHTLYLIPET
jgi:predicted nucleic acid-binding Zn ribbon protein